MTVMLWRSLVISSDVSGCTINNQEGRMIHRILFASMKTLDVVSAIALTVGLAAP